MEEFGHKKLTYSEAIEKVMINNGNYASLKLIYQEILNYRLKTGKTPNNTIQERVQRDNRFTRIAFGIYGLSEFIKEIEENDIGYFSIQNDNVFFKPQKEINTTEKTAQKLIRIGQNTFRSKLLKDMKKCPITNIDDEKLLIASHIKPWIHSTNKERLNHHNGLLLSPLYDKLFDKGIGLITFTLDKEILISKKLSKENTKKLGIYHKQIINNLPIKGREEFLEYHRKYILQK